MGCWAVTHPDILNTLLFAQHVLKGGEKVTSLDMSWSHQ